MMRLATFLVAVAATSARPPERTTQKLKACGTRNPDEVKEPFPKFCPNPLSVQSPAMKTSFDVGKIQGLWYEIAMKDVTQPRFCKCTTSNKTVIWSEQRISDEFTIQCVGKPIIANEVSFKLTNESGVLHGTWRDHPALQNVIFPDTVVDFGLSADGGYEWYIEFTCVQAPTTPAGRNFIAFYAISFYARRYDDPALLDAMAASAWKYGLGPFIVNGNQLDIVSHQGCERNH